MPFANEFVEGEYGVSLVLDTGYDIPEDSELSILIKKPSGITMTWPAIRSQSNPQKMTYLIQFDDLDEPGIWIAHAVVSDYTRVLYGSAASFKVRTLFGR